MEYKRLKLFIEFIAPKTLTFTICPYTDVNNKLVVGERELDSRDQLKECVEKWKKYITVPALRIIEKVQETFAKHYPNLKQQHHKEISEWKKSVAEYDHDLEILLNEYKKTICLNIKDFSTDLLMDFLPNDERFTTLFTSIIDKPSRDAKDTELGQVPLVELLIQRELQGIPFWLTRTYDSKTFWMSRYALSIIPYIKASNTFPPKIDNDVRVISITRPTSDLVPFFPFEERLFKEVKYTETKWKMIDGIFGKLDDPNNGDFMKISKHFEGVTRNEFRQNLRRKDGNTPNLIYYQGHWQNMENDGETTPHLFFSKPDAFVADIEELKEPTPLLSGVKPNEHKNSVLIMHACGSAAQDDNNSYIEKYITERSIFIGTNFPILSREKQGSNSIFENFILRKDDYLAHSVLRSNSFEPIESLDSLNFDENTIDEIYHKTAFCQFGDVRANFKRSPGVSGDNVSKIKIKTTDRWKNGLEKLGIKESDGFNYSFDRKISEYVPSIEFTLSADVIQIGLVPLATAIEFCENSDEYKIIGPAFTSNDTIDIISTKYKTKEEFIDSWISLAKQNKKIKIGVLNTKLTSFYFIKNVLFNELVISKKVDKSVYTSMIYQNAEYKKARNIKQLKNNEWMKELDIVLDLYSTKEERNKSLNVIFKNIESLVANNLNITTIPRGIFIVRSDILCEDESLSSLKEFFNLYNKKIDEKNIQDNEAIPLKTFDKTKKEHWYAIKAFADRCVNDNQSEFEVHDFYCCNYFCSKQIIINSAQHIFSKYNKFVHPSKIEAIVAGIEKITNKFVENINIIECEYIYLEDLLKLIYSLNKDEIHTVITDNEIKEFKIYLKNEYENIYNQNCR
jgi:hypothetical protein